jgi:hypothetical protein
LNLGMIKVLVNAINGGFGSTIVVGHSDLKNPYWFLRHEYCP